MLQVFVIVAGLGFLVGAHWLWVSFGPARGPKRAQLLPGPKGYPLVGNLLEIPPYHSWFKFKSWADKYGPIYRLNIAGQTHVVISTEKIANDLLRDRGSLYSSRQHMVMASDLMSHNLRPLLLPYNDHWRATRKLMQHHMVLSAAMSYQPIQLLESTRFLRDFIRSPPQYEEFMDRYASSLILRLTYGKSILTGKEEVFRRVRAMARHVERVASPGAYLVDSFPILMKLPRWIASFKREGDELFEESSDLFVGLLKDVQQRMAKNDCPPCFTKNWLENQEKYDLNTEQAAFVLGHLFEAGSGTTAAVVMSFLLALVHYPAWQTRLHAELDEVVGQDRLPVFDDIPNLPCVRAAVKETLRWRPVAAGGLPHKLIKDDVYEGYFLPAGTIIHPSQWAIHREPSLYPDAESFLPERWLDPAYPTYKEPLTTYPNLQNFSAFGFGRRICPGLNLAERSLNILVARIAWACQIEMKKDEAGKRIEVPWYDYITGFSVQPKWFPFDLQVRSEAKRKIIEEAWKEAMKEGFQVGQMPQ